MADVTLVVVRVGVYDQGIVGVAAAADEAKAIAERAAARERDVYHDFELRREGEHGEFDTLVAALTAAGPRGLSLRRGPRRWKTPGG